MKRGTFVLLFSIVLFGGGVAFSSSLQDRTSGLVPPPGTIPVVLAVLEVQGATYEIAVPQGSTVYELMAKAQEETDFSFSGREFAGMGFFVEEIQGKRQNPKEQRYWMYSINGQKAQLGISFYELQSNDVISWTYEQEE